MNKTIYKDFRGEESLDGFLETVRWKLTSYYGGPEKPGQYFVSDGNGKIYTLYCTGGTHEAKKLFDGIMEREFEDVEYSNGDELTNDDLIALYNGHYVWYDIYDCGEYDYTYQALSIVKDEDKPKYFMEPSIIGPIDSEIETYGKTYVDVHGNVLETKEES